VRHYTVPFGTPPFCVPFVPFPEQNARLGCVGGIPPKPPKTPLKPGFTTGAHSKICSNEK